jgi:polyferredoxin
MANKWRYRNPIRVGFQILILGLLGYVAIRPLLDAGYAADFEAYCPFGGLSSLMSRFYRGSMSCQMSEVQVMLGLGLLVGVLAVGKLFCSYLCPIGSVSEWLGLLGKKLKMRREMPESADRVLRVLKYALLFVTVYFTMTRSELFCKEYDPYFAVATLFGNGDIVLYYAIPALVVTVLGAMMFRLFWCKYLCPLGALSNVFLNAVPAAVWIISFVVANLLGAGISPVWLLAGLVLIGVLTEVGFLRSYLLPVPKVTRVAEVCSDCGICDEKCPEGIVVSKYDKVTHTDCHLCTDCVYACPLKNALSLGSHKKTWMKYIAPATAVLLVGLSLGAATRYEFTTIAERWGGFDSVATIKTFQLAGLKTVKCYSSSMSVKQKLQSVQGIYGVDAYASSHTVRVYYNPLEISEGAVKASLFTPSKLRLRNMTKEEIDSLGVMEIGIYRLFDLYDFNNLSYSLKTNPGVYGFETRYGEPVQTTIYYDRAKTGPESIRRQIETREVTVKKPAGEDRIELDFTCDKEWADRGTISLADYTSRIFRPYDREFNDYGEYSESQLSVWVFAMPEADEATMRRFFGSLSSHLSADDGIVRFSTRYIDGPVGLVVFDSEQTSAEKIVAALTKPTLTVFRSQTETQDMPNPFHIGKEGKVVKLAELKLEGE